MGGCPALGFGHTDAVGSISFAARLRSLISSIQESALVEDCSRWQRLHRDAEAPSGLEEAERQSKGGGDLRP